MTYVTARTVYFCLLIMNNLLNLMYSIDGTYGLDQSAHINRNYIFFLLYRVQPQKPHNETQFFILMIYSKSPFCGLAWRPIGVGGQLSRFNFGCFLIVLGLICSDFEADFAFFEQDERQRIVFQIPQICPQECLFK